jgi:hypothetical protein
MTTSRWLSMENSVFWCLVGRVCPVFMLCIIVVCVRWSQLSFGTLMDPRTGSFFLLWVRLVKI